MSEPEFTTRRICVVLLSGIGDVVHGLPLVNALKRHDPERHITWVVQPAPAPLLRPHPAVDEVIIFEKRHDPREVLNLRRRLQPHVFDLVLNCGFYLRSGIATLLAQAPNKAGFGRDRAHDFIWLAANHRLPAADSRHRVEMYMEFLPFLGIEDDRLEWCIAITEEERAAQAKFFGELGAERVVGIVPTSGRWPKDWPTERCADLATALERDFGFRVVLLGGPGAVEEERAREVQSRTRARTTWALGPDLRRLVYLVDGCDLVVAPDTGPLHIARALETPVIGLYGHLDPADTGSYGAYEDIWIDRYAYDAEGVPYTGPDAARPTRGGRHDRMELITVEDVLDRVELALERYIGPGENTR
jgi:heptosyltransferase I